MHFDIITLFPEMFPGTLGGGVVGRALENGVWSYRTIRLRDFSDNNYGSVDDAGFGGMDGQVMMAEPIAKAIEEIRMKNEERNVLASTFAIRLRPSPLCGLGYAAIQATADPHSILFNKTHGG